MHKVSVRVLVLAVLAIALPVGAGAGTITLTDVGHGWINNNILGRANGPNYAVGNTFPFGEIRNFFEFSIPDLGGPIVQAVLELQTFNVKQSATLPLAPLTYQLTSIPETFSFIDLGTGLSYAIAQDYTAADSNGMVSFQLNADAIAALQSAAGTGAAFGIGGRITAGAPLGFLMPEVAVFGASSGPQQLLITYVPEPAAFALWGSGLLALALLRRRAAK